MFILKHINTSLKIYHTHIIIEIHNTLPLDTIRFDVDCKI